nr:MAG TPA: hypothetical protein [Bacteriophage sp.]
MSFYRSKEIFNFLSFWRTYFLFFLFCLLNIVKLWKFIIWYYIFWNFKFRAFNLFITYK